MGMSSKLTTAMQDMDPVESELVSDSDENSENSDSERESE
jgi:hypothetical protein